MEFFIRHRTIVAFTCFTLFCIISLSIQSSALTFTLEGIGNFFVSPFQRGYDSIQNGVGKLWAGFTELNQVRGELNLTRKKLQVYESIAEELSEIRAENSRLHELLELKKRVGFDSIPSIIISKDPDNWFKTIVINKGENDGIRINMPVIGYKNAQKAVVGKIIEVRRNISRVLPIISPDMKMGCKLKDSRFPGLLYGYSVNSNLCIMDYISRAANLKSSNSVITSGQGGVFPQGLLVGKLLKAEIHKSSPYQRAIIVPVIDFNLLEEVFVIKKVPEQELVEMLEGKE